MITFNLTLKIDLISKKFLKLETISYFVSNETSNSEVKMIIRNEQQIELNINTIEI
jgi:hypothetical protein